MSEQHTICPGCGKQVVFQSDFSMSAVCDACGTIVVRPDFGHPATGQSGTIAAPDENDSPVELGMKGYYQGHHFEIRGVVRLAHEAGGFWDEWYLLFDDGRWGWLAEVQQQFYLTFAVEWKQAAKIPSFDEIRLEERFLLRAGDPPMTVAEKGYGRPAGARGEIPYALAPQKNYPYADLSGPGGRFATIDYEQAPPSLYFGRAVALGDLQLPHKPEDVTHEPRHVEAVQAICPNCNAALTLRAPHKTVRVGCTACGALLDADEGRLQFAGRQSAAKPELPMGATGRLCGVQCTVIGYLKRHLKSDTSSSWEEYLLYGSQAGYRWLTYSDDQWSFVEAVPPGSVELQGKNVSYAGKSFTWYEQDIGLVSCVLGEFYWKVDPGEQAWMTDYLRNPEMLSREITHGGPDTGEVSWSRAVYISAETVAQAFGLQQALGRSSRASPAESFSFGRLYALWALMAGLTLVLAVFFQFHHRSQKVFSKTYLLPAAHGNTAANEGGDFSVTGGSQAGKPDSADSDASGTVTETQSDGRQASQAGNPDLQAGQAEKPEVQPELPGTVSGGSGTGAASSGNEESPIFFSEPFAVRDHENLEIRIRALGTNFWLGIDGDLVDEQSGVVQEFSLPVEYYAGVSEGEAWSEGSREASVFISALPAGQYILRIAGQHEPTLVPLSFEVSVYEDVARAQHLLFALAGISLIPAVALLVQGFTAYSHRKK